MTKKRIIIYTGLGITMLVSIVFYWYYYSKPTSFPANEELIVEMNSVYPQAKVSVIQDTIPVGERHVLVPYITDTDDYGLSYWIWEKRKWRVAYIDTGNLPKIWHLDRNDPSTYYLVWNIHPNNTLGSMDFYLIQDRGFHITRVGNSDRYIERYYPKVQLEKHITVEESYGALRIPDDWVTVMNTFKDVVTANQSDLFNNHYYYRLYMHFGWIAYDQAGKVVIPKFPKNSGGYTIGNVDVEYIMPLSEDELELAAD